MRRMFAAGIAAVAGLKLASAADPEVRSPDRAAAASPPLSSVKPRHVLCFLGQGRDQTRLSQAAAAAIRDFATGFVIDREYSAGEPDTRMVKSFSVSRDRVAPNAWSDADGRAVATHQSVLYVLGPSMDQKDAVNVSMAALQLVGRLIDAGAVAVKGESAVIAHGLGRWRDLVREGAQAVKAGDLLAQQRIGRLAFAKRPLSDRGYLESVGFHLVGLPEVYVPQSVGDEVKAVSIMDATADEIGKQGISQVLKSRRGTLSLKSTYAEDDFKFNPYGVIRLAP